MKIMWSPLNRAGFLRLAVAGILALGAGAARAEPMVMKLGHDSPTDFPYQVAAEWFKKEVEAKTSGRVQVQIFPNAQLGDEGAMIDGLRIGSVHGCYVSIPPISESVPEVDLFSLPFIFPDISHALKVARGPIGQKIQAKIEAAVGGVVAGWGSIGDRDMWNSKRPIKAVADLGGLKMRTQQSAMQLDTYSALGAQPTPMPFSELYTALQTKVVDGADNGPADVLSSKFYQVTKYLTLTRHFIVMNPMLISSSFLAQLTPEDKATVLAAGAKSMDVLTEEGDRQNAAALEELKKRGIEVYELSPKDRAAFVAAVQKVYDKNADRVGGKDVIRQALETK